MTERRNAASSVGIRPPTTLRRAALITLGVIFIGMNVFVVWSTLDLRSRLTAVFLWIVPMVIAGAILSWRTVVVTSCLCIAGTNRVRQDLNIGEVSNCGAQTLQSWRCRLERVDLVRDRCELHGEVADVCPDVYADVYPRRKSHSHVSFE